MGASLARGSGRPAPGQGRGQVDRELVLISDNKKIIKSASVLTLTDWVTDARSHPAAHSYISFGQPIARFYKSSNFRVWSTFEQHLHYVKKGIKYFPPDYAAPLVQKTILFGGQIPLFSFFGTVDARVFCDALTDALPSLGDPWFGIKGVGFRGRVTIHFSFWLAQPVSRCTSKPCW